MYLNTGNPERRPVEDAVELLCFRSPRCWHGDVCRHAYSDAKRDAALACGKKITARPSTGCFKEPKDQEGKSGCTT